MEEGGRGRIEGDVALILMVEDGCSKLWSDAAVIQTGVGGASGRGPSSDVSLLGAIISSEMTSGLNGKTPVFSNTFLINSGVSVLMCASP